MRFVTDTHCLVWYLQDNPKLSTAGKKLFDEPGPATRIIIPAIVLAELLYISRKVSLPRSFDATLKLLEEDDRFEIYPLSADVIREAASRGTALADAREGIQAASRGTALADAREGSQAASLIPLEMHDLLIVATARHLNFPLMTSDRQIVGLRLVPTINP